jgi:flagellar biogenesis protein FliO
MRARVARAVAGVVVLCALATSALGEGIKPVIDDTYQERPLPARRGSAGSATTQAAGATSGSAQGDVLDLKRVAIALGLVLGAIYVSNRVWRRLGMPGSGNKASGSLQVMSRLAISPKQQILLIRVGRRLVLVGNSGGQMSSLTEIVDPEETAGLIGQAAIERQESSTATFNEVLGGEEKQFDPAVHVDVAPGEPAVAEDDASLLTTREELHGLMEKVRGLSQQFRQQQPTGEQQ